jgi:hypothetical protein
VQAGFQQHCWSSSKHSGSSKQIAEPGSKVRIADGLYAALGKVFF